MSKVIYTAANARYMVQGQFQYDDWGGGTLTGSWVNLGSFHNQKDATEYAGKEKRNDPDSEYQVVDLQAEEEN